MRPESNFRIRSRGFLALLWLSALPALSLAPAGCETIYGWDIHAPGLLSADFVRQVQPMEQRIALYLPSRQMDYQSKDKGSFMADPQTFHVGEAFGPMIVEAFQEGFTEFILMEAEPTPDVMRRYGIPYLALVRIKDFSNHVTGKGQQAVTLVTETVVLDQELRPLAKYESRGSSDARKVFAKRGGLQTNLNAAVEGNVMAIVQFLQGSIESGNWGSSAS